jgi:hypothetical protein
VRELQNGASLEEAIFEMADELDLEFSKRKRRSSSVAPKAPSLLAANQRSLVHLCRVSAAYTDAQQSGRGKRGGLS